LQPEAEQPAESAETAKVEQKKPVSKKPKLPNVGKTLSGIDFTLSKTSLTRV
jgi:hypothetical protein